MLKDIDTKSKPAHVSLNALLYPFFFAKLSIRKFVLKAMLKTRFKKLHVQTGSVYKATCENTLLKKKN